ncbi:uncharacterized protein IL334_002523 [Kwoniella shivajii]|uniref:Uncharacterized protein n=1 Tax=Kwoniella shivajii TaxID=564305 RepID=A0ABZ1CVL9_9TREE|nr:hypothetical protein IL334_002523 [Kwoniella shivajii]
MLATPPRLPPTLMLEQHAETPGPTKARINHLQSQVSELVRKNQGLERKLLAEKSICSSTIKDKSEELDTYKVQLKNSQKELERCKTQGDVMRDELNLHSMVQQQKALLALAQEQMQVVELEQRLLHSEKARIMRDHKIALFQAKEEDLLDELREREERLSDLETALSEANTSLVHQKASSSLSSSSSTEELVIAQKELSKAKAEITSLESKVDTLENKVKSSKEREKEARGELDNWLRDEKSKMGSSEKSQKDLTNQLRSLKNQLEKKTEELEETKDELEETKRSYKDREKVLKTKIREANGERDNLLGVEEELQSLKAKSKVSSPKKVVKEKVRKASPVQDDTSDEEVVPKKKSKKADSPVRATKPRPKAITITQPSSESESDYTATKTKLASKPRPKSPVKTKKVPLETSDIDNQAPTSKPKSTTGTKKLAEVLAPSPEPEAETLDPSGAVPKKKKRLLGGVKSAFEWDPIMGSGDGVIPLGLSPMKPITGKAVGTIPRAGFSATSRLNRLG